jgi:DedD protein
MAFFKFRLPSQTEGDGQGNFSNAPAQSVEALRRRARHRLIGASVLVLVAVVGFPLLFDTQPRPVSVDIAVVIPDRATSKPLLANPASTKLPLAASSGLDPKEEVVAAPKTENKPQAPVAAAAPVTKPQAKPAEAKPDNKTEGGAEAKPELKAEASAAKPGASDSKDIALRFVVQVGAFSEESKARDVRAKLEKAGFKTYTHVADTKEGKRTRVRVGPFGSRDEADKVAQKIKQLQLQPAVLSL